MEQNAGLHYYKSLISDQEVIAALMKESKAREGELERNRVRPNLTFFQRTVSNMVSSNKRITTKQEEIKAKEKARNIDYRPRRTPVRKKLPIQLIKEILTNKINFVKSSNPCERLDAEEEKANSRINRVENKESTKRKTKTPFHLMREILTNQVQFVKSKDTESICLESSSSRHKLEKNMKVKEKVTQDTYKEKTKKTKDQ